MESNSQISNEKSNDMALALPDAKELRASRNGRFCYRHHPNSQCKRKADEVIMADLQNRLEQQPKTAQEAMSKVWSAFSEAAPAHRNLMLQGILSQCCLPQLSFASSILFDLIRIDFVAALPIEIAFKILCYLDTASLCRAAQVSKRWRQLADDDVVWHRMCEQHIDRKCTKCGWGLPLLERRRLKATKRDMQERLKQLDSEQSRKRRLDSATPEQDIPSVKRLRTESVSEDLSPGVTDSDTNDESKETPTPASCTDILSNPKPARTRPWKEVYCERWKVEQNWRSGRYTPKEFRGHTNGVLCLQFDESILISGSYDTTVMIWEIESGELLKTLRGHTRGVRALKFDAKKLITGSMDGTIKIWNYRTGQCVSTLRGHEDGVLSLDFDEKLIVSGSADGSIRVWNFDNKLSYTLRGHTDWVNSVRIHSSSRTLYSASDDMTIRMWDLVAGKCIQVFGGSTNAQDHIRQVQVAIPLTLADDHIHDLNGRIECVPSAKFSPGANVDGNDAGGSSSLGHPGDEHCDEGTSSENESPVDVACRLKRLAARPSHILSCSLDNTIKLWRVKTGECAQTLFGHVEGVWDLAVDTFRIVSGAHDKAVKVWDLHSGKCLYTFTGPEEPVLCVGMSDSRIASGSDDGVVRMYSFI